MQMYDRNDPTDNWKTAKRREIRYGKILVFGDEKENAKVDEKETVVIIVDKHGTTFDKLLRLILLTMIRWKNLRCWKYVMPRSIIFIITVIVNL